MTHTYHMTLVSSNAKVGPIPVTTTSRNSCPAACPLKGNGCYAEYGNIRHHWDMVSGVANNDKRKWANLTLEQFVGAIKALPRQQLWRHNQAGDLPQNKMHPNLLDHESLEKITAANRGKRGFTYTHYPWFIEDSMIDDRGSDESFIRAHNQRTIRQALLAGFTINISANNMEEADRAWAANFPTVVVVPDDHPDRSTTPNGVPVIVCPAQTQDNINCSRCGICQRQWAIGPGGVMRNRHIVAFRVHGSGAKKAKLALELTVKQ